MHQGLLVKALVAMIDDTSIDQFQAQSNIQSSSVAKSVIDFMLKQGIGRSSNGTLSFSGQDRLRVASMSIQSGYDLEEVSSHLSWKDFEMLASEALLSLGYKTQTNLRFTRPRMELDVVGVQAGFAIAVDCKHWKRSNSSAISRFCKKQAARTNELVKRRPDVALAVPTILTLHPERMGFVDNVPVVPVLQFRSFVLDAKGFLGRMYVATKQGPASLRKPQR